MKARSGVQDARRYFTKLPACSPVAGGSTWMGGNSGSTGSRMLDGCSRSRRIVTVAGGRADSYL